MTHLEGLNQFLIEKRIRQIDEALSHPECCGHALMTAMLMRYKGLLGFVLTDGPDQLTDAEQRKLRSELEWLEKRLPTAPTGRNRDLDIEGIMGLLAKDGKPATERLEIRKQLQKGKRGAPRDSESAFVTITALELHLSGVSLPRIADYVCHCFRRPHKATDPCTDAARKRIGSLRSELEAWGYELSEPARK